MPAVQHPPVIKRLPSQLANQIAAGEVIERPASVLKELIENSLDADATRIEIDLLKGGMEQIVVTDNGYGVHADELPLALSRHATSKIEQVNDLLNLQSLGFRGEALASICSVSQWEIISRPETVKQAAKLSHLLADEVIEINHPVGTRVSVKQLFYNTPARKKFLRAEQTEYRHCYDVVKRMALARFDVAFYLKHNGRQILKLPAVTDDIGRSRRVAQVCGSSFIKQSVLIDYPHNHMHLWGWLSQAEYSRQATDLQYFYINGRIIRDRVVTHAIRSAYQHILPTGRHAGYVLHLEVDPAVVDVNVHPKKHEVRFREARVIHDFIARSIRDALQSEISEYQPAYSQPHASQSFLAEVGEADVTSSAGSELQEQHVSYQQHSATRFGNILAIMAEQFAITQHQQQLFLIDLKQAVAIWVQSQWRERKQQDDIRRLPLLLPERIALSEQQRQQFMQQQEVLTSLGFDLHLLEANTLLLRKVPAVLQAYQCDSLLVQLLQQLTAEASIEKELFELLKANQPDYSKIDLNIILNSISNDEYAHCWRELTAADLQSWLTDSAN
jgi:DNA mismatch repair protein MutL